jgi:hypothetical protein
MGKITMTFNKQGNVTIDTEGFTGSRCQDATAAVEAALGMKKSETMKDEYYQTVEVGEEG